MGGARPGPVGLASHPGPRALPGAPQAGPWPACQASGLWPARPLGPLALAITPPPLAAARALWALACRPLAGTGFAPQGRKLALSLPTRALPWTHQGGFASLGPPASAGFLSPPPLFSPEDGAGALGPCSTSRLHGQNSFGVLAAFIFIRKEIWAKVAGLPRPVGPGIDLLTLAHQVVPLKGTTSVF